MRSGQRLLAVLRNRERDLFHQGSEEDTVPLRIRSEPGIEGNNRIGGIVHEEGVIERIVEGGPALEKNADSPGT